MTTKNPRRARGRLAALAAAAACALIPAAVPSLTGVASAAEGDRSSFLLGVLPDTQFYSRYSIGPDEMYMNRFNSEPYDVQTRWLAEQQDELQIPFVTHLGDVVDRHGQTAEWAVADAAMRNLEDAGLPYSILAGNHDLVNGCTGPGCYDTDRNLANENFPRYFTPARAAAQSTFRGRDATGFHEFHIFEAEGRRFLQLALSWEPSDQAIAWAQRVIDDHPRLPVILTSHNILAIDSDAVSPIETPEGRRLWEQLIRRNDQIFLTLSGHNHGSSHLRKTNDHGHSVDQIVWDYQMAYMGGNGYLGLMEFDFTNDAIDTAVVSPWVRLKPADTLIPEYDQAVKTGPNENLRLAIDWDERFSGFEDPVTVPAPSNRSLIAAAKAAVLEGYNEPEVREPALPHDETDYPRVDGTLAHWRFDGSDLGPVQPGEIGARDISAAGADMRRGPLDDPDVVGAQLEDLVISADHHALSSNSASACFDNVGSRISYMSTAAEAAINGNTFSNGYTIESFIKIDADWTAARNQWMAALGRDGARRVVPGANSGNWGWSGDEPVFVLAISNLREIQWNAFSHTPLADKPNWSGEIMADQWMHVATVNDPVTRTTTMYVNGAPVLRNATNTVGLSTAELPWRIGSGTGGGRTANGWSGCVGETRIVDGVLPRDKWLTTRTYVAPEDPGREPGEDPDREPGEDPGRNPGEDPGRDPGTDPGRQPGTDQPVPHQPTPGPGPVVAPGPTPTGTPQPQATPSRQAAQIRSVRVRGRQLRVRVGAAAQVRVTVFSCRGGRCTRRVRTLSGRARRAGTVTVRLPRKLAAGRYRVVVTARSDGGTTRRTAVVQVRRIARAA